MRKLFIIAALVSLSLPAVAQNKKEAAAPAEKAKRQARKATKGASKAATLANEGKTKKAKAAAGKAKAHAAAANANAAAAKANARAKAIGDGPQNVRGAGKGGGGHGGHGGHGGGGHAGHAHRPKPGFSPLTPEQRKQRRDQRKLAQKRRAQARLRFLAGKEPGKMAAFKQEYRRHARRTARLQRMHDVASELEKPKLQARIEALMMKEQSRHHRWVSKRRAQMTNPAATKTPYGSPPAKPDTAKDGAK